jgi:hypothetical protein
MLSFYSNVFVGHRLLNNYLMVYLSIEPAGKLAFMKVIFVDIGITLGKKKTSFLHYVHVQN